MSRIVGNKGQPSYLVENDQVRVHVTVQGGHLTATFNDSISPFFTAPWSGRLSGVLGMEEIAGFFHYGIKESVEPNFLQEKGFKSFVEFEKARATSIKVIVGVVPIAGDFTGVRNIIPGAGGEITILGKGGESISVSCDLDFLIANGR